MPPLGSPSASPTELQGDEPIRKRIGPWDEEGLPALDQFDPDTNFVVTAAAGSGKTTALVARMVALVRQGAAAEDLTAITFTRKAAGEMSTRFFEELRRTRELLPADSAERRRVDRALGRLQSAFIGTIHAFCSRLLRERPLAAGLPPDFNAGLEDREERQLRERAWQQHLRHMNEVRPEAIEQITDCGLDLQNLTAFFERLCAHPELRPYTEGAPESSPIDPAVEVAQERLREWNERRPDELPEGRDAAMKTFDEAGRRLRYQGLSAPSEKAAFLQLFADLNNKNRPVTLKCWRSEAVDHYDWSRTLRDDLLPSLVEEHIRPVLRQWEAFVHEAVVDFTTPAIGRYRRLRRSEGLLTYHDLLSHTRDLLRDRPSVREEVQERYPTLLVDEFQDTDPLQAEILSFLASKNPGEDNWKECSPRDGSLFIVGDNKQSIYRFRRADKGVFDAFRKRIDQEPNGEAVTLTKNFRSRKPICNWCNKAFEATFDHPKYRDIQADYVPFDPQRPAGPNGTALRKLPLEQEKGNRGDSIAEQDATHIARFIRAARAGEAEPAFYQDQEGTVFENGVDFSDFLVLTRAKSRLGIYTDVLARHGIPYTVTGSEDLGESDELKAVVDLLRCALRPDDPVAAVAYLKGGLAGWSDEDLYQFRRAGGRFDQMADPVPESIIDSLTEERRALVQESFERLRRARSILREVRPGVGIEKIVGDFGLLAGAAHPKDQAEASLRAGALLRIISYVQHFAAQGLGWGEVTEELDLILEEEESVDGMTLEAGSDDAVRVMNVHQAKGLEAPVVFLADPYSSGRPPPTTLHLRREEQQIVAPVVQGEGYYERVTHPPNGWHEDTEAAFKAEEKRHEEAEERRLLYVAATRAEHLLVVSTYPEKPSDGPWSPLYEHLREAEVPELTVPESAPPEPPAAPAPDLERSHEKRARRLEAGAEAAYAVTPVTEAKEETGPLSDQDGYGASFGTTMHELFELVVSRRANPPVFSDSELESILEGRGVEETSEAARRLREMLEGFRQSWIWDELQEASTVHAEQEFAHVLSDGPEMSGEVDNEIRRGTVDLLYRRKGAWTIVDFKSDRVETAAGNLEEALPAGHPYREQVRAYRAAWADVTGESVEKGGLWFADKARFVPVVGEEGRPEKEKTQDM